MKETSNKNTPEFWNTLIQWQGRNTGKNCQDVKFSLGSLKRIQGNILVYGSICFRSLTWHISSYNSVYSSSRLTFCDWIRLHWENGIGPYLRLELKARKRCEGPGHLLFIFCQCDRARAINQHAPWLQQFHCLQKRIRLCVPQGQIIILMKFISLWFLSNIWEKEMVSCMTRILS